MTQAKKPSTSPTRRRLLVATSAAGGVATLGAAIPFLASLLPSEKARAAGAPVEVDISALQPGELGIFEWRGKPVWILKRTSEMLETIKQSAPKVTDPESQVQQQPDYAKNEFRSIKPEVLVMVGICTHLGCSPKEKKSGEKAEMGEDWVGGFYCPCHGSKFDFAGRVYKGAPAPINMEVPPHTFLTESSVLIGEDRKGG